MEIKESSPLKWPDGWSRTLLDERRNQGNWKKDYRFYRTQVETELKRMGASSVLITRSNDLKDAGVSVWFSMKPTNDFSWQRGLGIDNPLPTLDEIDSAFRRVAQKHHPDVVGKTGGDISVYIKAQEHRAKARAYVLGGDSEKHDNCIPMDKFADTRQNMAAIASALRYFRGLERLGMPAILDRVMSTAFRTALPEHKEASDGAKQPIAL